MEATGLPKTLQSLPPLRPEDKLGEGLAAEVYAWGDGQALKLFRAHVPRTAIEHEVAITKSLAACGAAAPQVRGTVEIEGRLGIVFQRVDGPSLFDEFLKRPWKLWGAVRLLAETHAAVHRISAPENFPSQRKQIGHWINGGNWTAERKAEAVALLERLPEGDRLCHGDFHPGNILLSKAGPVLIDWSCATRGHPLADVARTCVLFETGPVPEGAPPPLKCAMNLLRGLVQRLYLKHYARFHRINYRELAQWKQVQAAAGGAWANNAFY